MGPKPSPKPEPEPSPGGEPIPYIDGEDCDKKDYTEDIDPQEWWDD